MVNFLKFGQQLLDLVFVSIDKIKPWDGKVVDGITIGGFIKG